MKKLIILGLVLILSSYIVNGAFSQSGVAGNYSVDTDVVATIACTAVDKGDIGHYAWYNSSGDLLENDTLTCPTVSPYIMFASWKVTAIQAPQEDLQGNLTEEGVFISGAFFNITISGGVNDLDIIDVDITSEIFEGRSAGISGKIQNQGENVGYSDVCIDVLDENGEPFGHIGCKKSEMDGQFFMSATCDPNKGWCFGGVSYILDIDASCPKNNSEYISCIANGKDIEWASGGASEVVTVIDITDKMIVNKTVDIANGNGMWVENENGYRVNMTATLTDIDQENINWSIYSQEDGNDFLTAGEKFRVCAYYNNTFSDDKHITLKGLSLIKYGGKMVFPLNKNNGILSSEEVFLHMEVKSGQNQVKCGDWLIVPPYIKGQNKYKIIYHMTVEDYAQEVELNSDRFTVFGERSDTDYIDYLTINNVIFTKDNATEGEYIQLEINVTSNHPFRDITTLFHVDFDSNYGGVSRIIKPIPYNPLNWLPQTSFFHFIESFCGISTNVLTSPRFKIPYGLKDIDLYDIIRGHFSIHILTEQEGDYIFTQEWTGTEPTINISYYDFEITNLSLSIAGTSVSACSVYTATLSYNNEVSDTDAKADEEQRFIIRGCTEDTTNDIYLHCTNFEVQPDEGTSQSGIFITTLPYTSSNIEAEMDVFVYSYDRTNLDDDCYHCGELVYSFSGDEGNATYNITVNSADSCRYSQYSSIGKDDELYLQFLQADALLGINSSAGTFDFSILVSDTKESITTTVAGNGLTGTGKTLNRDLNIKCQVDGYPDTLTEFKVYCTDTFAFTKTVYVPDHIGIFTMRCTAIDRYFGEDAVQATDNFIVERTGGGETISTTITPINITGILYDVIIKGLKGKYLRGDEVKATITIKNLGDIVDKDTVMIYYLTNPIEKRIGEAREQFVEIPVGETTIIKSLYIPVDELTGEWRFNVEYYTTAQPTIKVYQSFQVVEKITIIDKAFDLVNQHKIATVSVAFILSSMIVYVIFFKGGIVYYYE